MFNDCRVIPRGKGGKSRLSGAGIAMKAFLSLSASTRRDGPSHYVMSTITRIVIYTWMMVFTRVMK